MSLASISVPRKSSCDAPVATMMRATLRSRIADRIASAACSAAARPSDTLSPNTLKITGCPPSKDLSLLECSYTTAHALDTDSYRCRCPCHRAPAVSTETRLQAQKQVCEHHADNPSNDSSGPLVGQRMAVAVRGWQVVAR